MHTKTVLRMMGMVALATKTLLAAPSVEITNVQQQYPWTNTVDITYTVTGVKAHPKNDKILLTNETYFVSFAAVDGDGSIPDTEGNSVLTNALVEGDGTFVAHWDPRFNLQKAGCKLTPSVFRGEEDAYLVVSLETNALGRLDAWLEPMSTQDASNARYNTDEYKTRKMVFRRVAKGRYTIGDNAESRDPVHTVEVAQDYYIGVFSVTVAQWARLVEGGGTAATLADTRPKDNVSWNEIRGSAGVSVVPATGICAILNEGTGRTGFDLPSNAMWEIAMRSGVTTRYFTGASSAGMDVYAWHSGNAAAMQRVGTRKPNNWGVYDFVGNCWNRIRDVSPTASMSTQTDALAPIVTGEAGSNSIRGGRVGYSDRNNLYFAHLNANPSNHRAANHGFRLSYYPQTPAAAE